MSLNNQFIENNKEEFLLLYIMLCDFLDIKLQNQKVNGLNELWDLSFVFRFEKKQLSLFYV